MIPYGFALWTDSGAVLGLTVSLAPTGMICPVAETVLVVILCFCRQLLDLRDIEVPKKFLTAGTVSS